MLSISLIRSSYLRFSECLCLCVYSVNIHTRIARVLRLQRSLCLATPGDVNTEKLNKCHLALSFQRQVDPRIEDERSINGFGVQLNANGELCTLETLKKTFFIFIIFANLREANLTIQFY